MIIFYAIILGVVMYTADFVVVVVTKQKFSLVGSIENLIDKISGENIWARLLIVLGTPFLSFYPTYNLPEDSFGYWVFMILGLTSLGYLGVSWFENQ